MNLIFGIIYFCITIAVSMIIGSKYVSKKEENNKKYINNKKAFYLMIICYLVVYIILFSISHGCNIKVQNYKHEKINIYEEVKQYKVEINNVKEVKDNNREFIEFSLKNTTGEGLIKNYAATYVDGSPIYEDLEHEKLPKEKFVSFFGNNNYKTIEKYTLKVKPIVAFSYKYFIFANDELKHYFVDDLNRDLECELEDTKFDVKVIQKNNKIKVIMYGDCDYRFNYNKNHYTKKEIKKYKDFTKKQIIKLNNKCNKILKDNRLTNDYDSLILLAIFFICGLFFFNITFWDKESEKEESEE